MRRGAVLCKVGGVLLCTVPTLVAVLECLPAWAKEGGAVSGLFAVLLILAAAPLYRLFRRSMGRLSLWPSWLFAFLLLLAVRQVIDGLYLIALVSFPAGLAGDAVFRLGEYLGERGREQ
jgi:hypothetical protein